MVMLGAYRVMLMFPPKVVENSIGDNGPQWKCICMTWSCGAFGHVVPSPGAWASSFLVHELNLQHICVRIGHIGTHIEGIWLVYLSFLACLFAFWFICGIILCCFTDPDHFQLIWT